LLCTFSFIYKIVLNIFFYIFNFSGIIVPGGFGDRGVEGKFFFINLEGVSDKRFLGEEDQMEFFQLLNNVIFFKVKY